MHQLYRKMIFVSAMYRLLPIPLSLFYTQSIDDDLLLYRSQEVNSFALKRIFFYDLDQTNHNITAYSMIVFKIC